MVVAGLPGARAVNDPLYPTLAQIDAELEALRRERADLQMQVDRRRYTSRYVDSNPRRERTCFHPCGSCQSHTRIV